ncbi:MAG: LytS/YhcK type 5TM receptor domain-containing protein [Negativicutes bacterium]|nr:LytS/YhcK type 5TM receptor domain-containing protein [Negativicutes bacterium]
MLIQWEYILSHLLIGLSLVLGFIFLLTKARLFRNIMLRSHQTSLREKCLYAVFFGTIGVLGTYTGFYTTDGVANTRAVGVVVGGLVGGPVVGLGAGIIAGIHRFFVGGVTAPASAFTAIMEGLLAGWCCHRFRTLSVRWPYALLLGFCLEALHLLLLPVLSPEHERALELVKAISPSMLIIDPLGIATFIAILDSVYTEQEKVEGKAARKALQIAGNTLGFLRKGLTEVSAGKTAETILAQANHLDAISVTSTEKILAFVGTGADHHCGSLVTQSTMQAIATGEYLLVQKRQNIGCQDPDCPLQAKIVVPLKDEDTVIGALVFYRTVPNSITSFDIELARGLAQLISVQIEVSKAEHQSALRAHAEIKALQAQINPHFLFNALNTIGYYCRKQPEVARELLSSLGDFYRSNLADADSVVSLQTELDHIRAYVRIESARFQGKLKVLYEIADGETARIPPLILQPIVENALKHGLYPKKKGGAVTISSQIRGNRLIISVADDGVGIEPAQLEHLLRETPGRKSIGLANVHGRLQAIYGKEYGLTIESQPGKGTRVLIPFPLKEE